MTMFRVSIVFAVAILLAPACQADSLEIQSNPVPDGTIQVSDGDPDRSEWQGIPWYEEDPDSDDFFPIDIFRVQIANDSSHVYIHLETLAWEVAEAWRVGTYLDTDGDNTTGYNGNFMAIGADYFVEAAATYEFTGGAPTEWSWQPTADIARDQSTMVDVEVAIPLSAIGHPEAFDFLLFANNFCCDFQLPDDIYPNEASGVAGDFFTYEVADVALSGDFDANGQLDLSDINMLSKQVAGMTGDLAFDLTDDQRVDADDMTIWVRELKGSWFGDANLDGEFNSSDLVTIFQAGKFELDVDASWQEGDWTGNLRFDSGDLVRAFQDGGFEAGRRAAIAVPEPSTQLLWCLTCCGAWRRRFSSRTDGRRRWTIQPPDRRRSRATFGCLRLFGKQPA